MPAKKSSFYHLRKRLGLNPERTAAVLGVDAGEVLRMDKEGAPAMAERLLSLWDSKDVGVDGWQGFRFVRGALVFKGRRWRPENLIRWSDNNRALFELEQQLQRLSTWRGLFTFIVHNLVR